MKVKASKAIQKKFQEALAKSSAEASAQAEEFWTPYLQIARAPKAVTAKPLPDASEALRKKGLKSEEDRHREVVGPYHGRLFQESRTGQINEIVKDTKRETILAHPKLFPAHLVARAQEEDAKEKQEQATNHFVSARSGRKYDPELYEQRTLESLKRAQWTIAAIERGSTIVVDPVEDLVSMIKTLEECGLVSVSRSNVTANGYTLTVDVTTATDLDMVAPETPEISLFSQETVPSNSVGTEDRPGGGFFKRADAGPTEEQKKILKEIRDAHDGSDGRPPLADVKFEFEQDDNPYESEDEWHGIPIGGPGADIQS